MYGPPEYVSIALRQGSTRFFNEKLTRMSVKRVADELRPSPALVEILIESD